ncbi:C-5 cytosine-specific DNA methylase [Geranomyces variabilis]|nr:C-5 cytosine-specific DNA methylase [Geranomyces variabilis]
MEPIRALEFFSGIGAMHYGLQWSGAPGEVVCSFDISPIPNACYAYNFGSQSVQVAIESLSTKRLASYNANGTWNGQPSIRPSQEKDDQDPRCKGILCLISKLAELPVPPTYIFFENVKNFEDSRTRDTLVVQLKTLGYDFVEWFLTPLQMGIPNDRGRYFLTARKVRERGDAGTVVDVPELHLRTAWPGGDKPPRPVEEFLEEDADGELVRTYKMPDAFVRRRQVLSDNVVVTGKSTRTACFTKAYGHHGRGAGSYLQTKGFDDPIGLNEPATAVDRLGLRYFTPTEIARLHAFPIDAKAPRPPRPTAHSFSFPPDLSLAQKWRVLGNSMNVAVVGNLMRVLFNKEEWNEMKAFEVDYHKVEK